VMLGAETQRNSSLQIDNIYPSQQHPDLKLRDQGFRNGLYVQDEWQWAPSVTATLGLRLDHNNSTGTHSTPRLGVVWHASEATTLRALAGRAHRAPTMFERQFADGLQVANPTLPGERITTTELVADHRLSPQLSVRASLYRWSLKRLITLTTEGGAGLLQFQPGEPVTADGLELSANQTFGNGASLRGHVSGQRLQQRGSQVNVNSPGVLASVNFSSPLPASATHPALDWRHWRLALEWQYSAARPTLAGTPTGAYSLANLQLATDQLLGHSGWGLALQVHNLTNQNYAHAGGRVHWQNSITQDGRSLRLVLTHGFEAP
jgi:outer membrane receptor protein involved in Fe transport